MTSSGTYSYSITNGEAVMAGSGSKAIVYCVRNLLTGDEYVGATEKSLNARKANHLWHSRRTPKLHFHRAVAKYGEANFEWFVLEECVDFFAALEAERRHIAERHPVYNKTDGGGGVKGYRHTNETKEKMRALKVGKPSIWAKMRMPDEVREKLAACRRSERGRTITDPAVRAKLKINAAKANAVRRNKVKNVLTGVVYGSVKEASLALGVCKNTVSNLCKSGILGRSGLQLQYVSRGVS